MEGQDLYEEHWKSHWGIENQILIKWKNIMGTFLVVQWLRLCAAKARVRGSIPGQGTKILHAKKNLKKKKKTERILWVEKLYALSLKCQFI